MQTKRRKIGTSSIRTVNGRQTVNVGQHWIAAPISRSSGTIYIFW